MVLQPKGCTSIFYFTFMIPAQSLVSIMETLSNLSDEMLSMTATLIEAEQSRRTTKFKELRDDEMQWEARQEMEDDRMSLEEQFTSTFSPYIL